MYAHSRGRQLVSSRWPAPPTPGHSPVATSSFIHFLCVLYKWYHVPCDHDMDHFRKSLFQMISENLDCLINLASGAWKFSQKCRTPEVAKSSLRNREKLICARGPGPGKWGQASLQDQRRHVRYWSLLTAAFKFLYLYLYLSKWPLWWLVPCVNLAGHGVPKYLLKHYSECIFEDVSAWDEHVNRSAEQSECGWASSNPLKAWIEHRAG